MAPVGQRVPYPVKPVFKTERDVAIYLARYENALTACNAQFPEGKK